MLSNADLDTCRDAFMQVDQDGSGSIDVRELDAVFSSMGAHPSEEEMFQMVNQVDDDGNGKIDFSEFLKLVGMFNTLNADKDDETDTIGAFVALGGKPDKSGFVHLNKLCKIVDDFELLVDVHQIAEAVDIDKSGRIDYQEFKMFMT